MKTQRSRLGVIGIVIMAFALGAFSQTADDLFQKALRLEKSEGKLAEAIELYQKVIAGQSNKTLAAQAQLRIGMCYEKMGIAEAVKAYELVIEKYSDQAEAVAEAKARLAALRKEKPMGLSMSRLLPQGVYLECQVLSPDGTKIAGIDFSKGQNVAVYDLASGKLEFVTNYDWQKAGLWTYVPVWSPDGQEIAFQAGRWTEPSTARFLWVSSLTGKSRRLYENPHGNIAPCDWLRDGSAIVAIQENENKSHSLGLVSVKEGSFRELYCSPEPSGQGGDPGQAMAGASASSSPDGRFIAFSDGPQDPGRDIFIISAGGGTPSVLIDHPADDKEPRWSPDGRHIVFLSKRHGSWALWGTQVRDGKPEGNPFMVLEGMQDAGLASWVHKGLLYRTTAFIRDIYTLEIDPQTHEARGKPQVLDFTPSGSSYRPQWSPDGKFLAFMPFQRNLPSSIFVMPAEGGNASKYDSASMIWQWLPDSSGLWFFVQDEEKRPFFKLLDLVSGQWKTVPISGGVLPKPNTPSVALSGDAKILFYVKMGLDGSEPGVVAYDLEKGQERYLYRNTPDEGRGSLTINASRDHKRLAAAWRRQILIVDTETGQVERLKFEKENLMFPAWSPDGKHLVAVGRSAGNEDVNEIFIVSLADKKAKSLDVSRFVPRGMRVMFTLDWSPDGKTIAYDTRKIISETNLIQNLIPAK